MVGRIQKPLPKGRTFPIWRAVAGEVVMDDTLLERSTAD
jgi:hypothetical protein